MAGTRTNGLVAAGAAAFVMCGLLLENDPNNHGGSSAQVAHDR
jgi:putative Mg2+ transporter-C (MgtC) family protein